VIDAPAPMPPPSSRIVRRSFRSPMVANQQSQPGRAVPGSEVSLSQPINCCLVALIVGKQSLRSGVLLHSILEALGFSPSCRLAAIASGGDGRLSRGCAAFPGSALVSGRAESFGWLITLMMHPTSPSRGRDIPAHGPTPSHVILLSVFIRRCRRPDLCLAQLVQLKMAR
jgi:hypothetical protein